MSQTDRKLINPSSNRGCIVSTSTDCARFGPGIRTSVGSEDSGVFVSVSSPSTPARIKPVEITIQQTKHAPTDQSLQFELAQGDSENSCFSAIFWFYVGKAAERV